MMNVATFVRRRLPTPMVVLVVIGATSAAMGGVVLAVDLDLLAAAASRAAGAPGSVALALLGFGLAFVLRALAWRMVLPGLGFGQSMAGIHLALGGNHVLPLRLGEPLRAVSVTRRAGVPAEAAVASTLSLRSLDLLALVAVGLFAAPGVFVDVIGPLGWLLLSIPAVVAVGARHWLRRLAADPARRGMVRAPGFGPFALAIAAWGAEAVLVNEAAGWAGLDLAMSDALVVTTVAVAAQLVAIAPGGFGTYEAAAVAAYVALGHDPGQALVAALGAHALKTVYSVVVGAVALWLPAPGLLGRFRLTAPRAGPVARRVVVDPDAPILLFMPAHNEQDSVAACVRRTPSEVAGRRVEVLIIDDGSSDATAERAVAAGAEVYSLDDNQGLGAAVRIGLSLGVERGAAATVFCDADGEYRPEELEALVAPILNGQADYVTGSRFLGRIEHMRPHRRAGNVILSRLLSTAARTRITDGQTGYRAFSPDAAGAAEVIHDYNYAQVLTLDLLAKGYRLLEVPISYRFRTEGESFIKLGRYLRKVGPAVYRELNSA